MNTTDPAYALSPEAFWGMTGPQFLIRIAPRELSARYGMPIDDRDAESLGTYVFTSRDGAVVTLYCRANDMGSLLLRWVKPLFWRSRSPVDITVGATSAGEGRAFAEWLSTELKVHYRPWP